LPLRPTFPLEKALDVIEDVARQADSVAAAFVKLFLDRVWKPFDRAGQPALVVFYRSARW